MSSRLSRAAGFSRPGKNICRGFPGHCLALGLAALLTLALPSCVLPAKLSPDPGRPPAQGPEAHATSPMEPAPEIIPVKAEMPDTPRAPQPEWMVLDNATSEGAGQPGHQPYFWENWLGDENPELRYRLRAEADLSIEDYQHYYTPGNLGALALGVALAAPLANTTADNHIHHWYQHNVRGETTDEYAQIMSYAGQFWLVLPVWMEARALMGKAPEDYSSDSGLYEWSDRSLRTMVVGVPPMLAMYVVLGASRPDRENSHWHPFQDIHGVSGHTYVGAVPFLTAAAMTDNEFLKVPLVLGSFLTGWSRINDDKHYFSQVALGWWMAYLAVRSVDDTQESHKHYTIAPTFVDGPGVALEFHF